MPDKRKPTEGESVEALLAERSIRYLSGMPKSVPPGRIVVHNHVRPPGFPNVPLGFNGFRVGPNSKMRQSAFAASASGRRTFPSTTASSDGRRDGDVYADHHGVIGPTAMRRRQRAAAVDICLRGFGEVEAHRASSARPNPRL